MISFIEKECDVKELNWNDGTALCKVINYLRPGLLKPFNAENKKVNCAIAIKEAYDEFSIPSIISHDDMVDPAIDDLSMMTYLSYFFLKGYAIGEGLRKAVEGCKAQFNIITQANSSNLTVSIMYSSEEEVQHDIDSNVGLYKVSYTPEHTGKLQIRVEVDKVKIFGSPFNLEVTPFIPYDNRNNDIIRAEGDALRIGISGRKEIVTIIAEDTELIADGSLSATMIGAYDNGIHPEIDIKEEGNGVYNLTYIAEVATLYQLNITHEDQPITDSPFIIDVKPAPDTSKCQVILTEKQWCVKSTVEFDIDYKEAGHGELSVTGADPQKQSVNLKKSDNNHISSIRFEAVFVGVYTIDVLWSGNAISDSPIMFEIFDPSKVIYSKLPKSADFLALVGQSLAFDIDASKAGKGQITTKVVLSKSHQKEIKVIEKDGVYNFNYEFTQAGMFELKILFNNCNVLTEPWKCSVVDIKQFIIVSPPEFVKKGDYVSIEITGVPADSKHLTATATALGTTQSISLAFTDSGASATFCAKFVGKYEVEVKYDGKQLNGSPLTIKSCDPDACQISGHVPSILHVKETRTITILTNKVGPGLLKCTTDFPTKVLDVIKSDGKENTLTLKALAVGIANVDLKWANFPIPKMQFPVQVVDASLITLKVAKTPVAVNEKAFLTIDCTEAGHGQLDVLVKSPAGHKFEPSILELNIMVFKVTFTPKDIGDYTVEARWSDKTIPTIPIITVFDPNQVHFISNLTSQVASAVIGECISFHIDATKAGKGTVTAQVIVNDEAPQNIKLTNKGIGIDILEYRCDHAGKIRIIVNFNDIKVREYNVSVKPRPDPKKCNATVSSSTDKYLFNVSQTISISVNCSEAGTGKLTAKATAGQKKLDANIIKKSDSVYDVQLVPEHVDTYSVAIFWAGKPIPRSPFTFDIVDTNQVKFFKLPKEEEYHPLTGEVFSFDIDVSKAGKGELVAEVVSAGKTEKLPLKETVSRVYCIQYTLLRSGQSKVYVRYNGKQLLSYMITVRGAPDSSRCKLDLSALERESLFNIGETVKFIVDCSEAGGGELTCKAVVDDLHEEIKVNKITERDNVYRLEIKPVNVGIHILTVMWAGKSITATPVTFKVVDPNKVNCNMLPKAYTISVGEDLTFTVDTSNAGSAKLEARIVQPDGCSQTIFMKEEAKGINNITYKFTKKTLLDMLIIFNHVKVLSFSCKATIPPDATKCTVTLPTLKPGTLLDINKIKIIDIEIDCTKAGYGELTASVIGPQEKEITVQPSLKHIERIKVYKVSHEPSCPGSYIFNIMWAGKPIARSPFKFEIVDFDKVRFPGLPNEKDYAPITGDILSFDVDISKAGNGTLKAYIIQEDESIQDIKISKKEAGLYAMKYTMTQAGQIKLCVMFNSTKLLDRTIRVRKAPVVNKCCVMLQEKQSYTVGQSNELKIDCTDAGSRTLSATKEEIVQPFSLNQTMEKVVLEQTEPVTTSIAPAPSNYQRTYDKINVPNIHPPASHDKCRLQCLDEDHDIKNPVDFSVDVTHAGSGSLKTKVLNPNGSQMQVYSDVNQTPLNILHHLKFNPKVIGKYTVNILWENEAIPGTPFTVNVIDPSKCTIKGLPLNGNAAANKPFNYSVHTKNAGDGKVHSVITWPDKDDTILEPTKKSDHIYQFQYKPDRMGRFSIHIFFSKNKLNGSPFPCKSVDTGIVLLAEAAIVCEPYKFDIQGSFPNTQAIEAIAHGQKDHLSVEVHPPVNNSHVACFIPNRAGFYEVFVEYCGKQIPQSPFSVRCIDPSKCKFLEDLPVILQVGRSTEFSVKTMDAGPGTIALQIDNEKRNCICETTVKNVNNNTYRITLMPKMIGEISVHILFSGYEIPRTPFIAQICDANKCKITADFIKSGKNLAGRAIKFKLDAAEAGIAKPIIKAQGPSTQYTVNPTEISTNIYECSFTPLQVGKHSIKVLWGIVHIPDSPFEVFVGQLDEGVCTAIGPGLTEAVLNEPAKFDIHTNKPNLVDEGILVVDVKAVHHKANIQIEDKHNGNYTVTYTAPAPGAYLAHITYNGKNITGSPFKIHTITRVDASKCQAYGPALELKNNKYINVTQEFYVNTANAGQGKLDVLIWGPNNEECQAYTKQDDNIYSVRFNAEEEGRYTVEVLWSKKPIPKSPFTIEVKQVANAEMVKAYGTGLNDGKLGDDREFTIETENAGTGTLTTQVHGSKGTFKVEVFPKDPDKPHILAARYNAIITGQFYIYIRWAGTQIPGSPFKVFIADTNTLISSGIVSDSPCKSVSSSQEEKESRENGNEDEDDNYDDADNDNDRIPLKFQFCNEDKEQMDVQV